MSRTRQIGVSLHPSAEEALAKLRQREPHASVSAIVGGAIIQAAALPTPPTLADETWSTLQASAKRRLRRALSEAELSCVLVVTRDWWVTGADAALINDELREWVVDALESGPPAEGETARMIDALFGPRVDPTQLGVFGPALADKLDAMSELDRAVLAVACREWWDARPKPPIESVLGGRLRSEREN